MKREVIVMHGRDAWISQQPIARRIGAVLRLGGDPTPLAEEVVEDLLGRRVTCTAEEVIAVVKGHIALYGLHRLGPHETAAYNDYFADCELIDEDDERAALRIL